MDLKILNILDKDSRASYKSIAKELNMKTSTLFHRLNRLKEKNYLDRFSIVINPENIGLQYNFMMEIKIKEIMDGKFNRMFLESFGKYLCETHREILFSGLTGDKTIMCICCFINEDHSDDFSKELMKNEYVEGISMQPFKKIFKGKKLFTVNRDLIEFKAKKEKKIEKEVSSAEVMSETLGLPKKSFGEMEDKLDFFDEIHF